MIHVQATIPFLPANAPVSTQVPGFSTMPETILQYRAEFSPTLVSAPDISISIRITRDHLYAEELSRSI